MKSMNIPFSILLLAALVSSWAGMADAQSIYLEPNTGAVAQLELLRPGFDDVKLSNLSFAYYLSAGVQVGETLFLRGELPYMYWKLDDEQFYDYCYDYNNDYGYSYGYGNWDEGHGGFGNPYLGLDVGSAWAGVQGEFGLRFPLTSDSSDIAFLGMLTDYVERMEAFVPDLLPVYAGINYRYRSGNGLGLRLRLTPVFWFWTGDESGDDTEVFALYSAQVWYEDAKVGVGGGFSGRYLVTEEGDLDERTVHQFGFFANYRFGNVLPGFQARFPLDNDLRRRGLSPTYSLSVGIAY